MGQDIKMSGTIIQEVEKQVIFTRRIIQSVQVLEDDKVIVKYLKISSDGVKEEIDVVPFQLFSSAENCIWKMIDEHRGDSSV